MIRVHCFSEASTALQISHFLNIDDALATILVVVLVEICCMPQNLVHWRLVHGRLFIDVRHDHCPSILGSPGEPTERNA